MSRHAIKLVDLKAIAEEEGVVFKQGDILIVRTGWTKWYDENSREARLKYITNGTEWVGVEGSEEVVEWLWDSHFAAVAGDNIGFEVWPTHPNYRKFRSTIESRRTKMITDMCCQAYMTIVCPCGVCQLARCGIWKS